MNEKLKELKGKEHNLYTEIEVLRKEIHQLIINIWMKDRDLKIGDPVIWDESNNIKHGILDKVGVSYGKAQPVVRLYKKDGSIGLRLTTWFGYNSNLRKDTIKELKEEGI